MNSDKKKPNKSKDIKNTNNKSNIISSANHVKQIDIVRDFLQSNKIFFDTVAASLLAIMAIIISLAQIFIFLKQNELIGTQAEIARQQAIPQFVITARQLIDPDGIARSEAIYVNNRAGIARDFYCNEAIFLDVELTPMRRGQVQKIEIPINGYYSSSGYTAEGTGQLLVISGYKSGDKLSKLKKSCYQLAGDREVFCSIELRKYLQLYYRDIFGKEHEEYYYVPFLYGGSPIEAEEGKKIFEKYKAARKNLNMVEFDELTADKLLELVK